MIKLLLGTLRLGVAENTVMDGLAIALARKKTGKVETAYNVSSDLGEIADTVYKGGLEALEKFGISCFQTNQPMVFATRANGRIDQRNMR